MPKTLSLELCPGRVDQLLQRFDTGSLLAVVAPIFGDDGFAGRADIRILAGGSAAPFT